MVSNVRWSVVVVVFFCAAVVGGCEDNGVPIDVGGEGEGEGAQSEGEGEGEVELIAADNDTCADAVVLTDGVTFSMPGFTATTSLHNCSATNAAGDDGIEDVTFTFVVAAPIDVVITADGDAGDGESYASPTLTLFDNPGCVFPDVKVIDDDSCVGDGLSFDAPTIMTLTALPAGTYFIVAETFGDLSPFTIKVDLIN